LGPTRLLKAESFRFAVLFALVFLTLTGALLGTVIWIVTGEERNTLLAANEADVASVRSGFSSEGLGEAVEVVQQRLGARSAYMYLIDPHGKVVVANLAARPCAPGTLTIALPGPGHHAHQILGTCARLGDGSVVFVGRDTAPLVATRRRILHAFGWVALGTCALAMLGGLFLGRRFMARVDAITQTCERVMTGRFEERIPVRGRDDEWDRLARAINEMLDRIAQLLENLQQVSSDVAHELRTPLTRLRNRLEAARDQATGVGDYSAAIIRALEDTDQVLAMFAALLRISQVEAGTRVRSFAAVDLAALLERLYQLYLPVAEDCGQRLSRDLPADLTLQGDAELLTQLFSNLIENALRHTPAGSRVHLTLARVGGETRAEVADDGPGIAAAERGKVTRRFYRGSASRSTAGHGLGLALAAAIAQLHGAKLALTDAGPGLRAAVVFRPAGVSSQAHDHADRSAR